MKPLRNIKQIHIRVLLGSVSGRVRQGEETTQNERKATAVIFWTVTAS